MTTTEQKIIDLLDGKYQYENLEYFELDEEQRDMIAKTIVDEFFWKMQLDEGYKQFYLEFIEFRIEELLKDEKYEAADLYQRLKLQINLQ
jgi:hypothetical protein